MDSEERNAGVGNATKVWRLRNAIVKIARNPFLAARMLRARYGPFAASALDPEFRRAYPYGPYGPSPRFALGTSATSSLTAAGS